MTHQQHALTPMDPSHAHVKQASPATATTALTSASVTKIFTTVTRTLGVKTRLAVFAARVISVFQEAA